MGTVFFFTWHTLTQLSKLMWLLVKVFEIIIAIITVVYSKLKFACLQGRKQFIPTNYNS